MSLHPSTHRFPHREIRDVAQLGEVRRSFAEWLEQVASATDKSDDLAVVVSELGANAIHGTPDGNPPARLTAWLTEGSTLVVEVANHVGTSHTEEWDLEDPLRTGGRGLLLVSAFVDDVAVEVEGDLLVVRCTTAL